MPRSTTSFYRCYLNSLCSCLGLCFILGFCLRQYPLGYQEQKITHISLIKENRGRGISVSIDGFGRIQGCNQAWAKMLLGARVRVFQGLSDAPMVCLCFCLPGWFIPFLLSLQKFFKLFIGWKMATPLPPNDISSVQITKLGHFASLDPKSKLLERDSDSFGLGQVSISD